MNKVFIFFLFLFFSFFLILEQMNLACKQHQNNSDEVVEWQDFQLQAFITHKYICAIIKRLPLKCIWERDRFHNIVNY